MNCFDDLHEFRLCCDTDSEPWSIEDDDEQFILESLAKMDNNNSANLEQHISVKMEQPEMRISTTLLGEETNQLPLFDMIGEDHIMLVKEEQTLKQHPNIVARAINTNKPVAVAAAATTTEPLKREVRTTRSGRVVPKLTVDATYDFEDDDENDHDYGVTTPTFARKRSFSEHSPKNFIKKRKVVCGKEMSRATRGLSASPKAGGKYNKSSGKPNVCEFCLAKFETPEALQHHRDQHVISDNNFVCTYPDCPKTFCTGEGLRLHVRNVHLQAKNWKCLADGCSRSFVRQSDLRMHVIRMHSDVRPFPCCVTSCQKSFACHSELRRHVQSCHKITCPKAETFKTNTNNVDQAYIASLMMKVE